MRHSLFSRGASNAFAIAVGLCAWAGALVAPACGGNAVLDGYPRGWSGIGGQGGGGTDAGVAGHGGTGGRDGGLGGVAGAGGASGGVGPCGGGVRWAWASGDLSDDDAEEVAVDSQGNIVVVGSFAGVMPLPGEQLVGAGGLDAFVVSLTPDGSVRWAHPFGDGADQRALAVAIDTDDSLLVAGTAAGTMAFGGTLLVANGGSDAFVAKLAPSGEVMWARLLGGAGNDIAEDVAVGPNGWLALVGHVGADADLGGGTLPAAGATDAFVAAFDGAGSHLWSGLYGDEAFQGATSVAIDSAGSVLVTGSAEGNPDFGGGALIGQGKTDAFVVKLTASGEHLWSTSFGNADFQEGFAVAVDHTDAVVVTGLFEGTVDFAGTPLSSAGARDSYLVKLDTAGTSLWARRFGDSGIDSVRHVDVMRDDDVVLTGPGSGYADYGCGPVGGDHGDPRAIVAKRDPAGEPRYATSWSDAEGAPLYSHQYAEAAADDGEDGLVVVGVFSGNIVLGAESFDAVGGSDWFVARLVGIP